MADNEDKQDGTASPSAQDVSSELLVNASDSTTAAVSDAVGNQMNSTELKSFLSSNVSDSSGTVNAPEMNIRTSVTSSSISVKTPTMEAATTTAASPSVVAAPTSMHCDGTSTFLTSSSFGGTEPRRRSGTATTPTVANNQNFSTTPSSVSSSTGERVMTGHEYAQLVEQWLWQQYWWMQQVNWMTWAYVTAPLFAAATCAPPPPSASTQSFPGQSPFAAGDARPPGVPPPTRMAPGLNEQQQYQPRGRECKIPSLTRRVTAEFIDFMLLFSVKLFVSIIAVDYGFNLFQSIPSTDMETLLTMSWDPNLAIAVTSELIVVEVINRIFICAFETICLSCTGATPGKRMLGMRVIACDELVDMPGNRFRIMPAGNLAFWNALVRSVIKNFSVAFFFPVCLTVFFFQHNRTGYDVITSSIVVELPEDDIWAMRLRR